LLRFPLIQIFFSVKIYECWFVFYKLLLIISAVMFSQGDGYQSGGRSIKFLTKNLIKKLKGKS